MIDNLRDKYFWLEMFAVLLALGSSYLFACWHNIIILQCCAVVIALIGGLINAWSALKSKPLSTIFHVVLWFCGYKIAYKMELSSNVLFVGSLCLGGVIVSLYSKYIKWQSKGK